MREGEYSDGLPLERRPQLYNAQKTDATQDMDARSKTKIFMKRED
jgi:hypothetical protein